MAVVVVVVAAVVAVVAVVVVVVVVVMSVSVNGVLPTNRGAAMSLTITHHHLHPVATPTNL